jgi:hypothetical protein
MDTSEGTAPPKEPPPPQVEPPPTEQSSSTMEPPPPQPPAALTKMSSRAKGKLRMPSPERPAEVPLDPLRPRHQSSRDSLLPPGQHFGVVEHTPGHPDRLGVVSETPAAAAPAKAPATTIQASKPAELTDQQKTTVKIIAERSGQTPEAIAAMLTLDVGLVRAVLAPQVDQAMVNTIKTLTARTGMSAEAIATTLSVEVDVVKAVLAAEPVKEAAAAVVAKEPIASTMASDIALAQALQEEEEKTGTWGER